MGWRKASAPDVAAALREPFAATSGHADEADRVAARADPPSDVVARVALDGLDPPIRKDALDDPDVLVEDDQVPGVGRDRGSGRDGAAGVLCPCPERVDAGEAL